MSLIWGVIVTTWCVVGLVVIERCAYAQTEPAERWFATGMIGGSSRNLGPFASLLECEKGQKTASERMAAAARENQRKAQNIERERFAFVSSGETGNARRVQARQRDYLDEARNYERLSVLWSNGAICGKH